MKHLRRISQGRAQSDDTDNNFREEFILRLVIVLVALLKNDFPI